LSCSFVSSLFVIFIMLENLLANDYRVPLWPNFSWIIYIWDIIVV
jgi:hypothetical protein